MGNFVSIIKTEERLTEHPFEDVLGIESGSTIREYREIITDPLVESPIYDSKDNEIEEKIEEIYALALGTASLVSDEIDRVEGRYRSSLAESATQALNIALGCVREKRLLKSDKDKLFNSPRTRSTNLPANTDDKLIVGTRNEIMKLLAEQNNNQ